MNSLSYALRRGARWPTLLVGGLFLLTACGDDGPTAPSTGTVEVSASTTGEDADADGYTVTLNGDESQSLGANASVTFNGVATGEATLELSGVAANCTVQGSNPQTVQVSGGQTATASFDVACTARTGDMDVSTSTTGQDQDPDGYTVTVDPGTADEQSQSVGVNATVTFQDLSEGDHEVELTGLSSQCAASGSNPRTVSVPFNGTASTTFDVSCSDEPGDLEVTTSTTGQDVDPDGYTVTVDPGTAGEQSQQIGVNATVTFTGLTSTDHEVELSGNEANCQVVTNPNPRTVAVPGGGTATTTFEVDCANRTGDLEVTGATSGSQQDAEYQVAIDGPSGPDTMTVAANDTVTFAGLDEGDYTVELLDVANNCWVDGPNPQTAQTVTFNQTTTTTFDVKCFAPLSDQIVFDSDRDGGDLDIYVMNPNGTGVTRLTTDATTDRSPAVSPDGTKIVFLSTRNGSNDLWIMNADGSNPRQLTDGNDFSPDWSPQGGFITFHRILNGQADVYSIREDGANLNNLTASPTSDDRSPAWSPDGAEIAFDSDRDDTDGDGTNEFDIYVMDNNGSNVTKITSTAGEDQQPQWDPSSCGSGPCQRLAFFSDRLGAAGDIYTILRDGTSETQLTTDPASDYHPGWSPSGSTIVFVSERDGNPEIWTMNASGGSGLTQITATASVSNKNPDWSP